MQMRNISRPFAAALVFAVGAALAGCGGGGGNGTISNSQIRAVDVGTNLVYEGQDTGIVLINGGASFEQNVYGQPGHYQYIQAEGTSLEASTTLPEPYMTYPIGTDNGNTTPVSVVVPPPYSGIFPVPGAYYTAYLVGRPDVPNPVDYPIPPAVDPADLSARYIKVVALEDNQAAPSAGHATVRAMSAVCDITTGQLLSDVNPLPTLNITVTGAGNNATYSNVPYASMPTPATPDQSLIGGTVNVSATATYTPASGGTQTVPLTLSPSTVSIPAGGKYTLVITEPTDITVDAVAPTDVPKPTYGVALIQD